MFFTETYCTKTVYKSNLLTIDFQLELYIGGAVSLYTARFYEGITMGDLFHTISKDYV